jgi:hypothetical protein
MPGRNGSEQVAGINRNQWPECVGIRIMQSEQDKQYPQEVQNNYSITKQAVDHSFIPKEFTFFR